MSTPSSRASRRALGAAKTRPSGVSVSSASPDASVSATCSCESVSSSDFGALGRRLRRFLFFAFHVEREEDVADRNDLALLGEQFADGSVDRRGNLDDRLVRLDFGDRLVLGDGISLFDLPTDEFALGDAFADVGQFEFAYHVRSSPRRGCPL